VLRQRTVKAPVRCEGVGLHSGQRVELTLHPAPPDHGIVFRRTDLPEPISIPADARRVNETTMASTLTAEHRPEVKVATVEHLMSALAGLGIDNLRVDVTAAEIPILDGSSGSFVYLVQSAGILEQPAPKRFLQVLQPVEVRDGDKWARLEPHFGYRLRFSIDFNHPAIDATVQELEVDFATQSYVEAIARSRTFGFEKDVEWLLAHGLAQGGSYSNTIVVGAEGVLNRGGLRSDGEFVRHKILDAIGDLYLVGHPLLASYSAHKSGHALNNRLLRALLETPGAARIATFPKRREAPRLFARDWAAA